MTADVRDMSEASTCMQDMRTALETLKENLQRFGQLSGVVRSSCYVELSSLTTEIEAMWSNAIASRAAPGTDGAGDLGRKLRLSLKFNIAEHPPWHARYFYQDPADAIRQILVCKNVIRRSQEREDLARDLQQYEKFHRLMYLRDLLDGEGIIPGCTTEYLHRLLKSETESKSDESDAKTIKLRVKVVNMNKVVGKYFYGIFWPGFDIANFTPEFICTMHKEAMEGLLDNCGQYRKRMCSPFLESHVYLAPNLLADSLKTLCADVRHETSLFQPDDFVNRVKLAADFLAKFLDIHPFSNGNGRVLTSLLLAQDCVVPVPLKGVGIQGRERYLQCLREAQNTAPFVPSNLARLVLDSVQGLYGNVCNSLNLADRLAKGQKSDTTCNLPEDMGDDCEDWHH